MGRLACLIRSPLVVVLLAGFLAAGCANKQDALPDNAAGLGLSGAGGAGGYGAGGNAAPGTSQDFTVNVGDRIFFDTDSSVIRADAQGILSRQAQWLNQYKQYGIVIEGHADERGTREYNLALGERRASVVRDYLVNLGVSQSRIDTVSYGKERPIAAESNEAAWAMNRNAFTQIMGGPSS